MEVQNRDKLTLGRLEDVPNIGATRRRFTLEFKTEAAHRVIDTGRSVAEGPPSCRWRTARWPGGYAISVGAGHGGWILR